MPNVGLNVIRITTVTQHDVLEAILRDAQGRHFNAMVQDPLWRSYYSLPFDYPVQAK
jgi:hypothetical protein